MVLPKLWARFFAILRTHYHRKLVKAVRRVLPVSSRISRYNKMTMPLHLRWNQTLLVSSMMTLLVCDLAGRRRRIYIIFPRQSTTVSHSLNHIYAEKQITESFGLQVTLHRQSSSYCSNRLAAQRSGLTLDHCSATPKGRNAHGVLSHLFNADAR